MIAWLRGLWKWLTCRRKTMRNVLCYNHADWAVPPTTAHLQEVIATLRPDRLTPIGDVAGGYDGIVRAKALGMNVTGWLTPYVLDDAVHDVPDPVAEAEDYAAWLVLCGACYDAMATAGADSVVILHEAGSKHAYATTYIPAMRDLAIAAGLEPIGVVDDLANTGAPNYQERARTYGLSVWLNARHEMMASDGVTWNIWDGQYYDFTYKIAQLNTAPTGSLDAILWQATAIDRTLWAAYTAEQKVGGWRTMDTAQRAEALTVLAPVRGKLTLWDYETGAPADYVGLDGQATTASSIAAWWVNPCNGGCWRGCATCVRRIR